MASVPPKGLRTSAISFDRTSMPSLYRRRLSFMPARSFLYLPSFFAFSMTMRWKVCMCSGTSIVVTGFCSWKSAMRDLSPALMNTVLRQFTSIISATTSPNMWW